MSNEYILSKIETLPLEAKKQVLSFIEFLQMSYSKPSSKQPKKTNFKEEKFVGMWRDRKDFVNSDVWLKKLRASEWRNQGE